jgi:hypothetical protein
MSADYLDLLLLREARKEASCDAASRRGSASTALGEPPHRLVLIGGDANAAELDSIIPFTYGTASPK